MGNRFALSMLLDIYSELLTEKQRDIMNLYYNEDYSLAEISEINNTSRQAIHDNIKRCNKLLNTYEEKLNLLKLQEDMKKKDKVLLKKLGEIKEISDNIDVNKKISDLMKIIVDHGV